MKVALGAMQDSQGEQLVSRQGEDRMTLRKNSVRRDARLSFNPTKGLKRHSPHTIVVHGGVTRYD